MPCTTSNIPHSWRKSTISKREKIGKRMKKTCELTQFIWIWESATGVVVVTSTLAEKMWVCMWKIIFLKNEKKCDIVSKDSYKNNKHTKMPCYNDRQRRMCILNITSARRPSVVHLCFSRSTTELQVTFVFVDRQNKCVLFNSKFFCFVFLCFPSTWYAFDTYQMDTSSW